MGFFYDFFGGVLFLCFGVFLREKGRERVQVYREWFVVVFCFFKKDHSQS